MTHIFHIFPFMSFPPSGISRTYNGLLSRAWSFKAGLTNPGLVANLNPGIKAKKANSV